MSTPEDPSLEGFRDYMERYMPAGDAFWRITFTKITLIMEKHPHYRDNAMSILSIDETTLNLITDRSADNGIQNLFGPYNDRQARVIGEALTLWMRKYLDNDTTEPVSQIHGPITSAFIAARTGD